MPIDITPEEATVLIKMVLEALDELPVEIRRTEKSELHDQLKGELAALQRLLPKLQRCAGK